VWVAKLDRAGSWQWTLSAGGAGADRASGIGVDSAGDIYVTGSFSDTATFGTVEVSSKGGTDVFVWKISAEGR
jgi:hypothetical protein